MKKLFFYAIGSLMLLSACSPQKTAKTGSDSHEYAESEKKEAAPSAGEYQAYEEKEGVEKESVSKEGVTVVGTRDFPEGKEATVDDILENPDAYLGKEVELHGTIEEQCPKAKEGHGCWLNMLGLDSKTGKKLYVEFQHAGLMYPAQYPEGTHIKLYGTVTRKGSEPTAKTGPVEKGQVYVLAKGAIIESK